jgi:hypothetical protein
MRICGVHVELELLLEPLVDPEAPDDERLPLADDVSPEVALPVPLPVLLLLEELVEAAPLVLAPRDDAAAVTFATIGWAAVLAPAKTFWASDATCFEAA